MNRRALGKLALTLLLPACGKCGRAAPTDDGGAEASTVDASTADLGDAGFPVVSFAAIGDVGKGTNGQLAVSRGLAAKCAKDGCDFVVMLGDNLYESGASSPEDPLFQARFETPYADVPAPFYVALGNHDYGAGGLGTDFARGAHQIAYTSHSKKWRMPSAYYRTRKEHVELFVMDTNMQLFGRDAEQRVSMASWISESTATWKIMIGHHPLRSNGPHGDAGRYNGLPSGSSQSGAPVESFARDVWCGKADLSLSGHDHSRQWLRTTCRGTELVVSGAGAELTSLDGAHAAWFQRLSLGFHYIRIQGRRMTIEFVDANGNVEFTRSVNK